jgi:hypothetical protein
MMAMTTSNSINVNARRIASSPGRDPPRASSGIEAEDLEMPICLDSMAALVGKASSLLDNPEGRNQVDEDNNLSALTLIVLAL